MCRNPLDPDTNYGPVVDKAQFDRVMSYIDKGKATARLVTGGKQRGDKGCFIEPTLFAETPTDSPIWTEEIFGPVLAVRTFETEEEAIAMANDSLYGLVGTLQAMSKPFTVHKRTERSLRSTETVIIIDNLTGCVYTSDLNLALRVAAALHGGGVSVNSPYLPELNTPFGGTKQSGNGRELGSHGLYSYLEPKAVHIR